MDLEDSSEIREAAALLKKFSSHRARPLRQNLAPPSSGLRPLSSSRGVLRSPESSAPAASVKNTRQTEPRSAGASSKGGRLEEILESMCLRGDFQGAVVADEGGLAVAEFRCPVESEAVAACSSVLGGAMQRAGRLLEQPDVSHLSMDINYVDKVVLRQFKLDTEIYYLLVICPQQVDERSEVEVTIDRISGVLGRRI